MKKITLVFLVLLLPLIFAGCGQKNLVGENLEKKETASAECQDLCLKSTGICPSLMPLESCLSGCASWSDEAKEKISSASGCAELGSVAEYVSSAIPKMEEPKLAPAGNDCEAACANYVNKCLSLVPNATQALFQEGLVTCVGECSAWAQSKTNCMISAVDCESMTEVCGL
jgi:hypothetical protein